MRRFALFDDGVYVYPIEGTEAWEIATWRGYQALWYTWRHHSVRTALYNTAVILGLITPPKECT
jgi:hypothetical protein